MKKSERKHLAKKISRMTKIQRDVFEKEHPELFRCTTDCLGISLEYETWCSIPDDLKLICRVSRY